MDNGIHCSGIVQDQSDRLCKSHYQDTAHNSLSALSKAAEYLVGRILHNDPNHYQHHQEYGRNAVLKVTAGESQIDDVAHSYQNR